MIEHIADNLYALEKDSKVYVLIKIKDNQGTNYMMNSDVVFRKEHFESIKKHFEEFSVIDGKLKGKKRFVKHKSLQEFLKNPETEVSLTGAVDIDLEKLLKFFNEHYTLYVGSSVTFQSNKSKNNFRATISDELLNSFIAKNLTSKTNRVYPSRLYSGTFYRTAIGWVIYLLNASAKSHKTSHSRLFIEQCIQYGTVLDIKQKDDQKCLIQ